MQKDLKSTIAISQSFAPAAKTSDVTGTGVDTAGYESATVVLDGGIVTDGTHTPKLQESDASGSGYTDVAAADLLGSFTAMTVQSPLAAAGTQKVGYIGGKRYIRVFVTVATASTGGVYGASVILGHARHQPAGATQTP